MGVLIQAASFTRPANTTAYASGDIVANSATAEDVVPLQFGNADVGGVMRTFRGARVRKSGTGANGNSWTLYLFRAPPDVSAGDNAALAVANGRVEFIGKMVGTTGEAWTDGTTHQLAPSPNAQIPVITAGIVYGLLQVNAAYAPASAETFTVQLFCTTYPER
jgi:hypothetical protein